MKIKEFVKNNINIIASFFIASLVMFLIYVFNGMVFGEYIAMRSDFLNGYIPIIKNTARAILEKDNILFSFSSCLGLNNIFYLANIIFSPFNILYLILFNVDENIVTVLVVLLKVGTVSASFCFFSRKILKNDKFSAVIVSCFYSLCAYTIAYCTITIMWLDAMLILPLLCVAIVDCFKNNKRVWLIVLYTYLFVSQFYIAYMVGIFSLVAVLLYMFILYVPSAEKPMKDRMNKFFNWVLCVVIAVLLSACVWVPTLFFILGNRAEDSTKIIDIDASLLQIVNSFFWGMGYNISGTFGYLYCGIPVFICLFLFLFCKKINVKEKIFSSILISIFLLCMISTYANLFLHVFDQPDFFFYRYSFVISFAACAVAARYLGLIDVFEKKNTLFVSLGLLVTYLIVQQTTAMWDLTSVLHPSLNDNTGFLVNLFLILLWIVIFWAYIDNRFNKKALMVLSVILMGTEIVTGSFRQINSLTFKSEYYDWYDFTEKTVKEIKDSDNGLYRIVYTNNLYNNADSWFSYNGIVDFGDQEKMKVRNILSDIGFATSPRYIDDTGYTDVSNMLLGVKYNLIRPYSAVDFEENQTIGSGYYVKNDYALSIGYLVDGNVLFYESEGRNAFENMNNLVTYLTGLEDKCFVKVPDENVVYDDMGVSVVENNNKKNFITNKEEGTLYITALNEGFEEAYMQVERDKSTYTVYDYFVIGTRNVGGFQHVPISLSTVNRMFYNEAKDRFHIVVYSEPDISPESLEFNRINLYYLDKESLQKQYDVLSSGQLEVTDWHNGYVKGTVKVNDYRRILLTTIPYDPGWSVKVNGVESDIVTVLDGAFVGVLLPEEGEYTIELEYEVPGLRIGIMTSLLGVLAFLSVVFEKKLKKKPSSAKTKEK